jgi:hypothetical protein
MQMVRLRKGDLNMKKISKTILNQLNTYMNNEARPLEKAIFNFYFNGSSDSDILDSLEAFQNPDGGFGRGLEPDFKLVESSPMATSVGLRHLSRLSSSERAEKIISKAIKYLEMTFDSNRKGWYSVPSDVNKYPHAPWWEFKEDINMTVIDYSWGNPTAELIGYLYKYKEYINNLDIYSLVDCAITNLNQRTEFKSEHEIYCYIYMYNTLDKEFSDQIEDVLKLAISQLINANQSEWVNYVPMPLKFINIESENYFGIEEKFIDENLDYLVDRFEEQGKMLPTWQWGQYLEQWETSKIEWVGILTLEALLSLRKFNRI